MAGIHDVAKLAGVSASTVSNVINGRSGKMRAETRQRVIDAIERLKFTPNGAARQLKSGQNTSIGLIIPSAANPSGARSRIRSSAPPASAATGC